MVNSINPPISSRKLDFDTQIRPSLKKTEAASDFDLQYGTTQAGVLSVQNGSPDSLLSMVTPSSKKNKSDKNQIATKESIEKSPRGLSQKPVRLATLDSLQPAFINQESGQPAMKQLTQWASVQPMMSQPMMSQPMMSQPMMSQPMMSQPMIQDPDSNRKLDTQKLGPFKQERLRLSVTDLQEKNPILHSEDQSLARVSRESKKEHHLGEFSYPLKQMDPNNAWNVDSDSSQYLQVLNHLGVPEKKQILQQLQDSGQIQVVQAQNNSWNGTLLGGDYLNMLGALRQPSSNKSTQSSSNESADLSVTPFKKQFTDKVDMSLNEDDPPMETSLNQRLNNNISIPKMKMKESLLSNTFDAQSVLAHSEKLENKKILPEVSAFVVPGVMSRPRITTDGLMTISSRIQGLSTQGGGEMRVRLKPENLGELHLRVIAHGNSVMLQIHASDERAKKIIEESLSYLKESLSAQQLTLSQVDLSVSGALPSEQTGTQLRGQVLSDSSYSLQDSMNKNSNLNSNQNQGQSNPWHSRDPEQLQARPNIPISQAIRTNWANDHGYLDHGRLNVIA